jgi:hypothetical protein
MTKATFVNFFYRSYQFLLTDVVIIRQKCYGPDKKILFKKPLFDLEVKGQGPTKVILVCDTSPYGHAPTFLSFEIGQLYLVCGCMTIRQYVAYHNDLRGTLIFDFKVK